MMPKTNTELDTELMSLIHAIKQGARAFAQALDAPDAAHSAQDPTPARHDDPALRAQIHTLEQQLAAAEQQHAALQIRLQHQESEHARQMQQMETERKQWSEQLATLRQQSLRLDPKLEGILQFVANTPALAKKLGLHEASDPMARLITLAMFAASRDQFKSLIHTLDTLCTPTQGLPDQARDLLAVLLEWHNQTVSNPALQLTLTEPTVPDQFNSEKHRRLPGATGDRVIAVLIPGIDALGMKPLVQTGGG